MAGRGIDHVVVAVGDLDGAAARYESLGFTLTPRASHPDTMGTANRLAQFAERNFIELLEVDRPDGLDDHDFAAAPPWFSFGAHNRRFVGGHEGISMLVLATDDARGDLARFEAAGLNTYAPFEFERRAVQPDGSEARVAFSLGFVTSPEMPAIAFFVCENKFPENFWKPAFQSHRNGARSIAAVYLAAESPRTHRDFLTALIGTAPQPIAGGLLWACGHEELLVMAPSALAEIAPTASIDRAAGPQFVGLAIATADPAPEAVAADDACGVFIAWRPA